MKFANRILKEMQMLREGGSTEVAYDVDSKKLTFIDNGRSFEFTLSDDWPFYEPRVKVDGRTAGYIKYGPTRTFRNTVDNFDQIILLNNAVGGRRRNRRTKRQRKSRRN